MKYDGRRESSSAERDAHQSDELGALRRVGAVGNLLLDRTDGLDTGSMALLAEGGELGSNGAAILAAGAALDEAVGLEPVDELGDVGADAAQPAGEVTEGEGPLALHELLERIELGDGEAHRSERFLEAILQLLGGLEHGDERAAIGPRPGHTLDALLQRNIVHIWNNTPDIQLVQLRKSLKYNDSAFTESLSKSHFHPVSDPRCLTLGV